MASFAELLGQAGPQVPAPPSTVNDQIYALEMMRAKRRADAEAQMLAQRNAQPQYPELMQGQVPPPFNPALVDVTGKSRAQAPAPMPAVSAPVAPAAPVQGAELAPVPGNPQAQPQPSPEELETRKQGWKTLLDGFMAQPNAKELLMTVGLKLLQGRRPGQSVGSQFGEALGTGVQANQFYKENQTAELDKLRKQGMEDAKHEVDLRRGTAEAVKTESTNDFNTLARPKALQQLDQELELNPKNVLSQIESRRAQAAIGKLNALKMPASARAASETLRILREAEPRKPNETLEQYNQRIARLQLQVMGSSKTNTAADLIDLANSTEDPEERKALLDQAQEAIVGRQTPAIGRGGTAGSGGVAGTYGSFAEAAAARKAGKLKAGQSIMVNGRKVLVE